MTNEELIERLHGYEWDDVEFKRAQRGVPENAYLTVSAFANTAGGWLVFGVSQDKGDFVVSGVEDVDKVQNDFLSCLRAGDKLSRAIDVRGEIHSIEGRTVLAFYIPELPRSEKPAYLKGDPRQSYIRRGGGDEKCTARELERFLRDAGETPFDSLLLADLDPNDFYDEKALAWYRRRFNEMQPGRHETLSDHGFLLEWGFLVESSGRLSVTRGALLLFGKARYVRRSLPRPVVDFQIIHERFDDWSTDRRWDDRIVVEDNVIEAWLAVVDRYMKHADRPFDIDAATLRRHDEPPDYISFREAAINLLIHQDYSDTARHPQMQIFRDRTRFWNPGDAFGSIEQLLEPGAKELRNPNIVAAFRRIGLSDQAGTGIRAIFRNWRQLGNVLPQVVNNKADKSFELTLLREKLLSDAQRRFQQELGASLNEHEAALLAHACRHGRVSLTEAKAITGLSGANARQELEHLVVNVLLKPLKPGVLYELADLLRDRYAQSEKAAGANHRLRQESRQELGPESRLESDLQTRIRALLKVQPLSRSQIADALGHTSVSGALNKAISRLMDQGLIEYTIPDKPQSRLQKYRLAGNDPDRL